MCDYYKTSATYREPANTSGSRKSTTSSTSSIDPSRRTSIISKNDVPARRDSYKYSYSTVHQEPASSSFLQENKAPPMLRRCCRGCENIMKGFLPLILLFFYTLLGGMIFHLVEKGHEAEVGQGGPLLQLDGVPVWPERALIDEPESVQLNQRFKEIVLDRNYTHARREQEIRKSLLWYFGRLEKRRNASNREVIRYFQETQKRTRKSDGHKTDAEKPRWDFADALFYAFSLYTTIGYGSPSPSTISGQVLTVFYALIGIPLAVITLVQLGTLTARLLLRLWSSFRHVSHPATSIGTKWTLLPDLDTAVLDEMYDTIVLEFPLSSIFFLLFLWMILTAAFFYAWEQPKWSYRGSLYFAFISFSTVGLGDYTPLSGWGKVLGAVFLFIGLVLIATILVIFLYQLLALYRMMKKGVDYEYQKALGRGERMDDDPVQMQVSFRRMISQLPMGSRILYLLMPQLGTESLSQYYKRKSSLINRGMQADEYMWPVAPAYNIRPLNTIGEEAIGQSDVDSGNDVTPLVMRGYSLPQYKGTSC